MIRTVRLFRPLSIQTYVIVGVAYDDCMTSGRGLDSWPQNPDFQADLAYYLDGTISRKRIERNPNEATSRTGRPDIFEVV